MQEGVADRIGGCRDCLGKSHSDFVGSTPPFAEIYAWKYEICECVFADSQIKGPRGAGLPEKGKEEGGSLQPDCHLLLL